jgi:Ni/Co efflux regulator RcnB
VYYYAGAPAYCEEAVKIEMKKNLSTIIAAAIVASLFMLPADARPKKQKRPDPQRRHEVQTQTPSLDGRITGRTRTCWFETLQYDGLGVPYGPYCH